MESLYDGDQIFSRTPSTTQPSKKISDHAVGLINYMKSRPEWSKLDRVYLEAGCEWRHYGQPAAVKDYARLIKRIREKIADPKVIIVASASDSTDFEPAKGNNWNQPLYESLYGIEGVAVDLHRYRGMGFTTAGPDGATAPTLANVTALAETGVKTKKIISQFVQIIGIKIIVIRECPQFY